jgi:hypothetical protein
LRRLRWRAALLALLLSLGLAGVCRAADEPGAAEPDLYMDAMRAIAAGRQDEAATILEHMQTLGAHHAGEWLELALIHCALGNAERAEALFSDIEARFAPPPGIEAIIERQREIGCLGWQPNRLWTVGMTRGHDSNANQGATNGNFLVRGVPLELLPEFRPQSDQFSTVTVDYLRELNRGGDMAYLQAGARRYDQLSQYDTTSLFGGVEHSWPMPGNWQVRGSLQAGVGTLGGRLYQQQGQLQLRATPPIKLPDNFQLQLSAGLARIKYKTLSNFDATTFDLRTLLDYRKDTLRLQSSVGYLQDQGNGARPGGDRHGWTARLYGRRALVGSLQGELDLSYLSWQGDAVYSPTLIDARRRQRTGSARAALIYPVGAQYSVQLEWRRVENRENISIFQYRSQQLQLTWQWNGP